MIRFVEKFQALHCTICGQWIEVTRQIIRDPDKLVDKIDREKQNHKDCQSKKVERGNGARETRC